MPTWSSKLEFILRSFTTNRSSPRWGEFQDFQDTSPEDWTRNLKDAKCIRPHIFLSSRAGFPWISSVGEKRQKRRLANLWKITKYGRQQEVTRITTALTMTISAATAAKTKKETKTRTMMSQPQRKQKQHIFDKDMVKTVGFDSKNRRHTQSDRVRNIEVGRLIRAEVGNAWDAPYSVSFGSCPRRITGNSITSKVFKCIETASQSGLPKDQ